MSNFPVMYITKRAVFDMLPEEATKTIDDELMETIALELGERLLALAGKHGIGLTDLLKEVIEWATPMIPYYRKELIEEKALQAVNEMKGYLQNLEEQETDPDNVQDEIEFLECLVDGAHGIHLPQEFVNRYLDGIIKVKDSEEWDEVLDIFNDVLEAMQHNLFLFQDGDLFLARSV